MRHCHLAGRITGPRLDRDHRLAPVPGLTDSGGEIMAVPHTFNMQADGRHPVISGKRPDHIGHGDHRLIPEGDDIGNRQPVLIHGQVDRQVG